MSVDDALPHNKRSDFSSKLTIFPNGCKLNSRIPIFLPILPKFKRYISKNTLNTRQMSQNPICLMPRHKFSNGSAVSPSVHVWQEAVEGTTVGAMETSANQLNRDDGRFGEQITERHTQPTRSSHNDWWGWGNNSIVFFTYSDTLPWMMKSAPSSRATETRGRRLWTSTMLIVPCFKLQSRGNLTESNPQPIREHQKAPDLPQLLVGHVAQLRVKPNKSTVASSCDDVVACREEKGLS